MVYQTQSLVSNFMIIIFIIIIMIFNNNVNDTYHFGPAL